MVLCDVNIYVYAFRTDTERHKPVYEWLQETINSPSDFGICELALSGFLRIVTHPKIFKNPDSIENALNFIEAIRSRPNAVTVRPEQRHWNIFSKLCTEAQAKGNLIPDAYFAALAIEHGCEWVTTDRDFSRFPGLKTLFL